MRDTDPKKKYTVGSCTDQIELAKKCGFTWIKGYKYNGEIIPFFKGSQLPKMSIRFVSEKFGYALFADEHINKGSWVGCYYGEVTTRSTQNSSASSYTYRAGPNQQYRIDAEYFGNHTRFLAHAWGFNYLQRFYDVDLKNHRNIGYANVTAQDEDYQGASGRTELHSLTCLYAIRDIKAGSILLVDYGPGYWQTKSEGPITPQLCTSLGEIYSKPPPIKQVTVRYYCNSTNKLLEKVDLPCDESSGLTGNIFLRKTGNIRYISSQHSIKKEVKQRNIFLKIQLQSAETVINQLITNLPNRVKNLATPGHSLTSVINFYVLYIITILKYQLCVDPETVDQQASMPFDLVLDMKDPYQSWCRFAAEVRKISPEQKLELPRSLRLCASPPTGGDEKIAIGSSQGGTNFSAQRLVLFPSRRKRKQVDLALLAKKRVRAAAKRLSRDA